MTLKCFYRVTTRKSGSPTSKCQQLPKKVDDGIDVEFKRNYALICPNDTSNISSFNMEKFLIMKYLDVKSSSRRISEVLCPRCRFYVVHEGYKTVWSICDLERSYSATTWEIRKCKARNGVYESETT